MTVYRYFRKACYWQGVFIVACLFVQPAYATCASGPCVDIYLYDEQSSGHLPDHNRLMLLGGATDVRFVTDFLKGQMSCGTGCNNCNHGTREYSWSVSPANDAMEVGSGIDNNGDWYVDYTFLDTGVYTVSVVIGDLPQLGCNGTGQHSTEGHGGASNSFQVTVWDAIMSAAGQYYNAGSQIVRRAEDVTFSVELKAAQPVSTGPEVPFDWWSETFHWDYGAPEMPVQSGTQSTWPGKIVDFTVVNCDVTVENPYDASHPKFKWVNILIDAERRDDWFMTAKPAILDTDIIWQNEPTAFPRLEDCLGFAANTNCDVVWMPWRTIYLTPIYTLSTGGAYELFDGMVSEIVDQGPNNGLWYNSSSTMYTCERVALQNWWTMPERTRADKPDTVPTLYNGYDWLNWYTLQTDVHSDTCQCIDPGLHSGVGQNIRYRANEYHELYGPPGSPCQSEICHQKNIELAVDQTLPSGERPQDPVWLNEDNVEPSKELLRSSDEEERFSANGAVDEIANIQVHERIDPLPYHHSFHGPLVVFEEDDWNSNWLPAYKDCY